MIDCHSEGSLTGKRACHGTTKKYTKGSRSWVTVDILPDIALLDIFNFYLNESSIEAWHTLVHVSRKWRTIVFGSPRRLNLRLLCGVRTRVRETLDIWPPLPIVIRVYNPRVRGMKNILAALEHHDRIFEMDLTAIPNSLSKEVLAAIQRPLPLLTHLQLGFEDETAPVDSDLFLGGSASHLQSLLLDRIPFPGLPKLLLSGTHLVNLAIFGTTHSGYISPEAMLTGLSVLTRLESLAIVFRPPRSAPDWNSRYPPPQTRILLPVLTDWRFRGASEYLEVLVAWINAPLLDNMDITFFHQMIFDTPKLTQFISRTPKFKIYNELEARVAFSDSNWRLMVTFFDEALKLAIECDSEQPDQLLVSLAQVCRSSLPLSLILAVEDLYILDKDKIWGQNIAEIENSNWLEFFRPFTSVKDLYISREIAPDVEFALHELVARGRVTDTLPSLQTLFLEETEEVIKSGPVQESIGPFFAARELAGSPFTISHWEDIDD